MKSSSLMWTALAEKNMDFHVSWIDNKNSFIILLSEFFKKCRGIYSILCLLLRICACFNNEFPKLWKYSSFYKAWMIFHTRLTFCKCLFCRSVFQHMAWDVVIPEESMSFAVDCV